MFKAIFVSLALLLASCSSNDTTYFSFNGKQYVAVGADTLTKTETSISGTGKLAFKDPLSRQQNNYALVFTLTDGGKLTLVTHSDNALANGLNVVFTRTGATYDVKLVKGTTEVATGQTGDATGTITLSVDNHNNEPHFVLFDSAGGEVYEDESTVPGKGDGTVWGLELQDATITNATLAEAKKTE